MRYPTRTQITIFAIIIAVLAALGLRFHAFAATPSAPRLLTCLPGQTPTVTYSYVGGWSQPIETCPPPIDLPQGLPLWPTDTPESFPLAENRGGTLIQTYPDWKDIPESIPLPESNTGNVVYNAADPVYAQLFQPNSEESACLSQGGVFSSGIFGSSCAYQSVGGVVDQPGTVVDASGWTADQFGTTVDSVGGTADQMGNVAPNFNNEEAASQACVNAGNIYVWGQGCDVIIPMGGVVEGPGSVVDMIGSAVSGTGFQAPQLGDPGVDATYCAMAAGGFGACNPGSTVAGFKLNAKSRRVWENEADWYRSHPQDAPAGFWDEYNQAVNPQPAAPDVASQPAAPQPANPAVQSTTPDPQNYHEYLGAVHIGTGDIYINNDVAAPYNQPVAPPQGSNMVIFHKPPGQVIVGDDVNVTTRNDGVIVLSDQQGNTTLLPAGTVLTSEEAPADTSAKRGLMDRIRDRQARALDGG